MKYETLCQGVETYLNGNIGDFKALVKRASKKDLLTLLKIHKLSTTEDWGTIILRYEGWLK